MRGLTVTLAQRRDRADARAETPARPALARAPSSPAPPARRHAAAARFRARSAPEPDSATTTKQQHDADHEDAVRATRGEVRGRACSGSGRCAVGTVLAASGVRAGDQPPPIAGDQRDARRHLPAAQLHRRACVRERQRLRRDDRADSWRCRRGTAPARAARRAVRHARRRPAARSPGRGCAASQGRLRLAGSRQHRLLVGGDGGVERRDGLRAAGAAQAAVEERLGERRAERPDAARRVEQRSRWSRPTPPPLAPSAHSAGSTPRWATPMLRVRCRYATFRRCDVGPPLEQVRRAARSGSPAGVPSRGRQVRAAAARRSPARGR